MLLGEGVGGYGESVVLCVKPKCVLLNHVCKKIQERAYKGHTKLPCFSNSTVKFLSCYSSSHHYLILKNKGSSALELCLN